jgi:hypothetical protein
MSPSDFFKKLQPKSFQEMENRNPSLIIQPLKNHIYEIRASKLSRLINYPKIPNRAWNQKLADSN